MGKAPESNLLVHTCNSHPYNVVTGGNQMTYGCYSYPFNMSKRHPERYRVPWQGECSTNKDRRRHSDSRKSCCEDLCPDTLREALCKYIGCLIEVFTQDNSSLEASERIGKVKCVSDGVLVLAPFDMPKRYIYYALRSLVGFQVCKLTDVDMQEEESLDI